MPAAPSDFRSPITCPQPETSSSSQNPDAKPQYSSHSAFVFTSSTHGSISSDFSGNPNVCNFENGRLASSRLSRPRFVKVRRHLSSGTTSNGRLGSSSFQFSSIANDADQSKFGSTVNFGGSLESNRYVSNNNYTSVGDGSSFDKGNFAFGGFRGTSETASNSLEKSDFSSVGKPSSDDSNVNSHSKFEKSKQSNSLIGDRVAGSAENLGSVDEVPGKEEYSTAECGKLSSDDCKNGRVKNKHEFGKHDNLSFVFGSSQFHLSSNFNLGKSEFSQHFEKLGLGDKNTTAETQKVKATDPIVYSCLNENSGSGRHHEKENLNTANIAKASGMNSFTDAAPAFVFKSGPEVCELRHVSMFSAMPDQFSNRNIKLCDVFEERSEMKKDDGTKFIFVGSSSMSSGSTQTLNSKQFVFQAGSSESSDTSCSSSYHQTNDESRVPNWSTSPCNKINLFSKSTNFRRRKVKLRQCTDKLHDEKHYKPEEINVEESSGRPSCSPMDFSPYQESTTNEHLGEKVSCMKPSQPLNNNPAPSLSHPMLSAGIFFDDFGGLEARLGNEDGNKNSRGTLFGSGAAVNSFNGEGVCSSTRDAAAFPGAEDFTSNTEAKKFDSGVQYGFTSGSETFDQASFVFSASPSSPVSSTRNKRPNKEKGFSSIQFSNNPGTSLPSDTTHGEESGSAVLFNFKDTFSKDNDTRENNGMTNLNLERDASSQCLSSSCSEKANQGSEALTNDNIGLRCGVSLSGSQLKKGGMVNGIDQHKMVKPKMDNNRDQDGFCKHFEDCHLDDNDMKIKVEIATTVYQKDEATNATQNTSASENVASVEDTDVSAQTQERYSSMQFRSSSGQEDVSQGSFIFTASLSGQHNSVVRKCRDSKSRNKRRNGNTTQCSAVEGGSSSTQSSFSSRVSVPSQTMDCQQENGSFPPKDEVKSHVIENEMHEEQRIFPSAVQEACEKWRFRGNQAYKNGCFSRAERFYTKGINSVPDHETSSCCKPLLLCYSNRAASQMSLGRIREAIDDCIMAVELDPNFLKVQMRAANCHLVLGEIDDAIGYFNKCLASGGNVCLDRRLLIEAADGLQRAKKVAEYMNLATTLLGEGSDVDRALKVISEAISVSKFSEKLLEKKAEALYMLQKYEEVIQLCEQSLLVAEKNFLTSSVVPADCADSKGEGNADVKLWRFYMMAKSHFSLGRLGEALHLLQKVEKAGSTGRRCFPEIIESSSSLSTIISKLLHCKNMGNEAFRSRKYAEAVEHYTAALSSNIESHPFAAICFCNRAAAYQTLGQISDAIADCSLAISLNGSYTKAISRRVSLYELIRDHGQAANDLRRLLSALEDQQPNQKNKASSGSGGSNNRINELRKAQKRLGAAEGQAKKAIPLEFYLILGVQKSDTAADIKKAYRKAALRHHPDKAGQFLVRSDIGKEGQLWRAIGKEIHEDADRLFKIIGEAYAVLSDASKRTQYDMDEEIRGAQKESSSSSSSFSASPFRRNNNTSHDYDSNYYYSYGRSNRYWGENW